MELKASVRFGLVIIGFMLVHHLSGQERADTTIQRQHAVRVFIDCTHCDMNYVRDEIPYVNYVRDVREAQMLKMGLMSYVAKTPLYREVVIDPTEDVEKQVVVDKWNNWVFELEARPEFRGEESYKELSLRSSVSAMKITHDWKLEIDFDHRYTRTKYTYEDTLYTNDKSYRGLDILVVKSLGEHWSAGIRSDVHSLPIPTQTSRSIFCPPLSIIYSHTPNPPTAN